MSHNVSSAEQFQKRSASRFKAKLAIPWPLVTRNGRRLRVVKYCYADKYTRDLFDCPKVQRAFTLWADRLGYPAGQATGHSLSWDEADDRNPDPSKRRIEYCFQPELSGGKAVWNDKVDKDTLRISENLDQATGSYASVGYRVGARYTEGYHWMVLSRNAEAEDIAHEVRRSCIPSQSATNNWQLGHGQQSSLVQFYGPANNCVVFGMVHEFTRNDRRLTLRTLVTVLTMSR